MPPSEYDRDRNLILFELERQREEQKEFQSETRRDLGKLLAEVSALKVKAGIWGAIAGAIPAIGALVWSLVK